jgi:DNA-binding ferritin-like protein
MARSHVIAQERTPRRRDEDELQQQLNDLLSLAVVGDHVRWVAKGDGAAELVEWLTEAVAEWRGCADRVAQHLSSSGLAPDGRIRSLATDIPVNWVPDGWLSADEARRLVLDRIATVARLDAVPLLARRGAPRGRAPRHLLVARRAARRAGAGMSGCSLNPDRMRLADPPERSYAGIR